jgi:hypothetical protein
MALHYDALPINLVVDDGEFLVFQIVSDGGSGAGEVGGNSALI